MHITPPSYSSSLALCDFWLLAKLKGRQENRFEATEGVYRKSPRAQKVIPEGDFNVCFEDVKIRYRKCIVSGAVYFDGDEVDLRE